MITTMLAVMPGIAGAARAMAPTSGPDAPGWRMMRTPAFSPAGELTAVAAITPRRAWAVGNVFTGPGKVDGAIEAWNGRTWRIALATSSGIVSFHDVAAAASDRAWAVGSSGPSPLAYRWNGRRWASASLGLPASGLFATVAARSRAGTWGAVATSSTEARVVRWSGRSWRQVGATLQVPGGAGSGNDLTVTSVAILSRTDVWVGGFESFLISFKPPVTGDAPLAYHWNGHTWKTVTIPLTKPNTLGSVARIRVVNGHLWAVGSQSLFAGSAEPLLAELRRGAWRALPVAPPIPFPSVLTDVAADGRGGMWVSGNIVSGPALGVLERWNGTRWVSGGLLPPGGPAHPSTMDAVGALAQVPLTRIVWAAGDLSEGSGAGWPQPLVDVTGLIRRRG
jgi:hypothetical protein